MANYNQTTKMTLWLKEQLSVITLVFFSVYFNTQPAAAFNSTIFGTRSSTRVAASAVRCHGPNSSASRPLSSATGQHTSAAKSGLSARSATSAKSSGKASEPPKRAKDHLKRHRIPFDDIAPDSASSRCLC
jgi:hypothetical protein